MPLVLGLSAYYHDAAAALVRDGEIVAAAQEERFTRRKHDERFPAEAARACLEAAGATLRDVELVAFYDKPLLKFDRLIQTYLAFAPRGLPSFAASMPSWTREKLFTRSLLQRGLAALPGAAGHRPALIFPGHHRSHAASAFFPSPFEEAAVLCLDGVGEHATTSAWLGRGRRLEPCWEIGFPHSLGLLYSAFTEYLGFRVNSAEYKVMGLAPYGEPRFVDRILGTLVDVKEDGSFRLDMRYFDFATGLRMTGARLHALLGGPPRAPEGPLEQRHKDLARSLQVVTEEVVLRLARTVRRETGARRLCLAGGVALNCVANGRVLRESGFDDLWIQPAAGDAGGALGAALSAWHEHLGRPRAPRHGDAMQGALLGPAFGAAAVDEVLRRHGAVAHAPGPALDDQVAALPADGGVVGWFQGRMEFGPRALGGRSILADPRDPAMQSRLNLKIKFRESFRPFAPAVLAEAAPAWFGLPGPSPYMLVTAPVSPAAPVPLPAVTHVDGSARVQVVEAARHPRLHRLLRAFERRTGCPALVNTSFNVRGEPIVCTPEDAYRCFMKTGMDHLVLEDRLLHKAEQPPWREPAPSPAPRPAGWRGRLAALARPLAPVGRAWLRLGEALGAVNGRLVFGAAWLLLVFPYAAAYRLLGRVTMPLGFDPGTRTYRSPPDAASGRLDRPY